MTTRFELPMMVGNEGKYLRVNDLGTGYEWEDVGSGGIGYTTIETDGSSVTQRAVMNFSSLFIVEDDAGDLRTNIDLDVSALATDDTFITNLAENDTFVNDIIDNSTFITNLSENSTFVTNIANNSTFTTALTENDSFITDLTTNTSFINSVVENITETGGGLVQSVTGLNTDNTDSANPVVKISVDGTTVTGDGTPLDPLTATSSAPFAVTLAIAQTGHGFSVGQIIRSSGTAGEYTLSKADSAADAEVVGVVSTVVDANNFIVTTEGFYSSGVPTEPAGTIMFLDTATAGNLITTAPSTSGTVNKALVTIITSAAQGYFHNYRGYLN